MDKPAPQGSHFYKTTVWDILLIGLVLLFSVASILKVIRQRGERLRQERRVLIYQDNRLIEEVNLEKDGIIDLKGVRMQVELKEQRVKVAKSDCPQHICMNMGWIKYSGQTIACVPNRVMIEIKSKEPSVIDAVSY